MEEENNAKRCMRCGLVLPLERFCVDRSRSDGLHRFCRPCNTANARAWSQANPERARAITKRYRDANPDMARRSVLRRRYLMTLEEHEALSNAQDGRCAICRQAAIQAVDHDHETGRARGLLCHPCNRGLGQFRDNAVWLEAAAAYLREHASVEPTVG